MPRDTTVRTRVIEYLARNGPIDDASGRATSRLKEAVGYAGGDAGFIRIVGLMAESGEIERDIKGKRTYRISVAPGTPVPTTTTLPPSRRVSTTIAEEADVPEGAIDYDELASTLLARVAQVLSAAESSAGSGEEQGAWARRRIDQLEGRLAAMQRDLARARADTEAVREERDELRSQLEAASHNLELLTERLGGNQGRQAPRAADRLGSEEQALLYRLRGPQREKPTRVG